MKSSNLMTSDKIRRVLQYNNHHSLQAILWSAVLRKAPLNNTISQQSNQSGFDNHKTVLQRLQPHKCLDQVRQKTGFRKSC